MNKHNTGAPWQPGQGQLDRIHLQTTSGTQAELYRHGAHLTSWRPALDGRDRLFLSQLADFSGRRAIRGGVPVIFPQFGAFGPGAKHGFARDLDWCLVEEESQLQAEAPKATLRLADSELTRSQWPFRFEAVFAVALTDRSLSMALTIENTDQQAFSFTSALHSYFAVRDIASVAVAGLQGLSYWDNGNPITERAQAEEEMLHVAGPIDRVYFKAAQPLTLIEGDDRLSIEASGFEDVVVWNPGLDGAKQLADMADDEFRNMLCIEAAVVDCPITLAPGEQWRGCQIIRL